MKNKQEKMAAMLTIENADMNLLGKLYDLPDSEFQLGGKFDALARADGYYSGKAFCNENNAWSLTLQDAIDFLMPQP